MTNTEYSIKKVWYYLLCMTMTLQLIAYAEETHGSYTAVPEVGDIYIDQLEELTNRMKGLQENSECGEKKGQYPTESRTILTGAIDDTSRSVLLIKYQNPILSEQGKQRCVVSAKSAIDKFKDTIRAEDAETTPAELFVDGKGGNSYVDFERSEEYVKFGERGHQSFTIELRVKVTKHGRWNNCLFLCSYMSDSSWYNGWMIYWHKGDSSVYHTAQGGLSTTSGDRDLWEPKFQIFNDLNKWQHFVAVYSDEGLDGNSTLRTKLYLNGELKKEETISPTTRVYQSRHYSGYSKPMTAFGRYMKVNDDLCKEGSSGYMKKVRIWKTTKGADYVKQSYEGTAEVTGKRTGSTAGWDFISKPSETDNEITDLIGRHAARIIGTYKWERILE